jgi:hypothetical protein
MLPDAIFTPSKLAERLVGAAKATFQPRSVIDITAGNGELLRAAKKKWAKAGIFAWDIDSSITRNLRKRFPLWNISTRDALGFRQSPSPILFDLVVLNPPFSCRGGAYYFCNIAGEDVKCSRAGLFLAKGLSLLDKSGQLLAILPVGVFDNAKDVDLWKTINKYYRTRVITENCPKSFPGLRIRTLIIRVTKRPNAIQMPVRKVAPSQQRPEGPERVRRGSCPAGRAGKFSPGMVPLIHTTHVGRQVMRPVRNSFVKWHWFVSGPAVLIPRVGNPNCVKISSYTDKRKVVISDCLFAVSCDSAREARFLVRLIIKKWAEFKRLYKGTCAQFLTGERLRSFLRENAFNE